MIDWNDLYEKFYNHEYGIEIKKNRNVFKGYKFKILKNLLYLQTIILSTILVPFGATIFFINLGLIYTYINR